MLARSKVTILYYERIIFILASYLLVLKYINFKLKALTVV